jgi:hypothetical protein
VTGVKSCADFSVRALPVLAARTGRDVMVSWAG